MFRSGVGPAHVLQKGPPSFRPPSSNALPLWGRVAGSVAQRKRNRAGFLPHLPAPPIVPAMVMIVPLATVVPLTPLTPSGWGHYSHFKDGDTEPPVL